MSGFFASDADCFVSKWHLLSCCILFINFSSKLKTVKSSTSHFLKAAVRTGSGGRCGKGGGGFPQPRPQFYWPSAELSDPNETRTLTPENNHPSEIWSLCSNLLHTLNYHHVSGQLRLCAIESMLIKCKLVEQLLKRCPHLPLPEGPEVTWITQPSSWDNRAATCPQSARRVLFIRPDVPFISSPISSYFKLLSLGLVVSFLKHCGAGVTNCSYARTFVKI